MIASRCVEVGFDKAGKLHPHYLVGPAAFANAPVLSFQAVQGILGGNARFVVLQRLPPYLAQFVDALLAQAALLRPVAQRGASISSAGKVCHADVVRHSGRQDVKLSNIGRALDEAIPLTKRAEKLWLVVIAGFGQQPIVLMTNLKMRTLESESLWWTAQIFWTRWKVEETFRHPLTVFADTMYTGVT